MSSEVEDGGNEMPEQSLGVPVPPQKGSVASNDLHCPQCGGLARRGWSDVFVLNLTTLLIFGALAPFMVQFFVSLASVLGGTLVLAWVVIALISLFVLPVTGAIAVAARPRCGACGHRFWPAAAVAGGTGEARFPFRFAVVGSAILLVPLGIGMALVAGVPGRETWTVTLVIGRRIIMAALAFGAGLLSQAILWRVLRTRMVNPVRRGVVLLLPAIVLGAGWLALTAHDRSVLSREYGPLVRAPHVLARAQLAELPQSAHGVAVHIVSFMLSRKYYLRFAAESSDIERFLADSPSLEGIACRKYSRERMRIKSSNYRDVLDRSRDGHEYFYPISHVPAWYEEEIRGAGRRYEINPGASSWFGEVIVDDEQHVVYVHLHRN